MSSSSSLSSSTTTTATTTSARIRLPSISELTSRSTISGGSNSGNGSALKSQISPRLSDTSRILPSILKNTSGSSTPTSSSTPFKCPPIKSTIGGSLSSGNTQSNYVLGNTKINNLPRLSSPTLPAKVQPQQQPHLPPASSLSPVTRVINTPPQQPQSVSASTSPNTQYQYYQYQQQSSPIQQQQQQQQATPAATPTVMQMAQNQPSHPAPLQYATQQYYPQPVYYQSPAGVPPPPPSVTHQGHIIAVHQHPGHLPQVGVNGMPPNVGYTIVQPEIVNKSTNRCHRCGTTETPEWRRGPKGVRTLCNACGLFHAKLVKRKGAALAAEEVLNNKVTKGKNGRRISMKKHLLNESLKQQQQINGVGIPINGFNHQILPPSFKPQQGGIATLPPLMHGQYPNNVNNLVIHQPPPPQQQQQQHQENESKQSHTKSPKPPLQSIHSGTSNAHPQSQPQHKHKHNTSLNNGYPNELVNSTIGLSNRILELLNDSQLQVDIINSEKLVNSSVIVYTIELSSPTTKIVVKRRYSEFKSLRDNLLKLFPTLIIPPIPEKHSILSYLLNTINHSHEISIIEMRKRYFKMFLDDLIFQSDYKLKNCPLLHKFFDPNYELCWYNALNEPPVSLIPDNLLLANPINPADQNGLYSLLPIVNGFDFNSHIDNLSNLKKINEDLYKLNDQVKLYELKGFEQDLEFSIPEELIQFEIKFHQTIKILTDLNKLNSKTTKNYKSMVDTLIDLGGNLNNFSLQVYQQKSGSNNELSEAIEKFGSTMDQSFLNFESFILNQLVPQWQEPVDQLILYLQNSLGLIKFYKYKIVQFKILYKLKFNKFQQLINLTNIGGVSSSGSGGSGLLASRISTDNDSNNSNNSGNNNNDGDLDTENFDHLKELNSPTINNALKNLSAKKISKKSSWYGLFGGNNQTKKFNFQLPIEEPTTATGSTEQQSQQQSAPNSPQREQQQSQSHHSHQTSIRFKLNHIEKELNKLNQLIELCNQDMHKLTEALVNTFEEFLSKIERKWLQLMITYIQNCKNMFEANLTNWKEFKESLVNETREVN